MKHTPISVIILSKALTPQLERAVNSVSWAEEILIINTSETSFAIKSRQNVRVVTLSGAQSPITDFSNVRNHAAKEAKHDLVLFLDDDEEVVNYSPQLLEKLPLSDTAVFTISRTDIFHARCMQHGEASQEFIRFGRKKYLTFKGTVHEVVDAKVPVLNSGIIAHHYAHSSVFSFIEKVSRYARAVALQKKISYLQTLCELLLYPGGKFVFSYFIQLGVLDGWRGLAYAVVMSLHSLFVRIYRIEQIRKEQEVHGKQTALQTTNLLKILSWVIVVSISLGQLTRVQLGEVISFYIHDILIFFWISLVCISSQTDLNTSRKEVVTAILRLPLQVKLLTLWISGVTLLHSILFSQAVNLLYLLRIVVYSVFAFSLPKIITPKKAKIQIFTIGISVALTGILQWLIIPDVRFLQILGWDPHYYRLVGTLFDPAFTGILLTLALFFWKHAAFTRHSHYVDYVIGGTLISSIALTYSRSTYLALASGIGYVLYTFVSIHQQQIAQKIQSIRAVKYWGILSVFALLVLLAAPKPGGEGVNLARTASIEARVDNASDSSSSLDVQTLLVGRGVFIQHATHVNELDRFTDHSRVPDNLLILLISGMGIPGMLLAVINFYTLWKVARIESPYLAAALIAVFIHGQFQNTLFQPFVWLFLWIWMSSTFWKTSR